MTRCVGMRVPRNMHMWTIRMIDWLWPAIIRMAMWHRYSAKEQLNHHQDRHYKSHFHPLLTRHSTVQAGLIAMACISSNLNEAPPTCGGQADAIDFPGHVETRIREVILSPTRPVHHSFLECGSGGLPSSSCRETASIECASIARRKGKRSMRSNRSASRSSRIAERPIIIFSWPTAGCER